VRTLLQAAGVTVKLTRTTDGRADGLDVAGMDVWEVDDAGRATSVHAYWNVGTLLTQLGLV